MQLSQEIFNILKGANIKIKLFDPMGNKTLDPELSARFYAYDNDFLITIREEEDGVELVVQAGASFNFNEHNDLLNSIKKAGHNAMAEYNIRKFDKNIELKDFAHDVVKEDEEIRRLKELSGIKEDASSPVFQIMKKSLLRHKWYLENEEMDPNMVSSELRDVNKMIEAVDIGEHEPYFDTAVNDDYRALYREAIAKSKGKKTSIYGVDNDVLPPNAKPNPKSAYNSGEVEKNDAELDALNP